MPATVSFGIIFSFPGAGSLPGLLLCSPGMPENHIMFYFNFSRPLFLIVCWLAFAGSAAAADTVWLKNGDHLSGTVRSLEDGKLIMDTDWAGTLSLNWSAVSTLNSKNLITLRNSQTGENYNVRLEAAEPGWLTVVGRNQQERKVAVARIDDFMKAKVKSDRLNWTGNVDMGINLKHASTETQDTRFSFNSKIGQGQWRHNFGAAWNREKEDASVNTHNYSLRYAIDYTFREQFFWQGRASYKRDWVEDLAHQALIGTGPGYQFWDNERGSFSLSLLTGAFGYGYNDGTTDSHFGSSLRWDYQRYLRGKALTLFSHGEVGHSLDEDGIFTLDAEVGVRYALTSWSTLNIGYGRNLVSGTRDTLNERRFTTGLGVKW